LCARGLYLNIEYIVDHAHGEMERVKDMAKVTFAAKQAMKVRGRGSRGIDLHLL
jgi:hypothetical protein